MFGLLVFIALIIFLIYGIVWLAKPKDATNKKELQFYYESILDLQVDVRSLKNKLFKLEAEVKRLNNETAPKPTKVSVPVVVEPVVSTVAETVKETVMVEPIDTFNFDDEIDLINTDEPAPQKPAVVKAINFAKNGVNTVKPPVTEAVSLSGLFNKIGAVALIIGMGFFLKYAFDNHWISPWIQVLFGFLVSGGLLYTASRFFKQEAFKNFSQGLSGAGIAISYLSTFAAFNFYHLINESSAFILLCVSTIVALTQALKYDTMAVAILGLIGGFITPLMLSFQTENPLGLYSYLVFVNGLVVALLIKKAHWKPLEYMGIVATYGMFLLSNTFSGHPILAAVFISAIAAIYTGLDVYRVAKGKGTSFYTAIANGILFSISSSFLCHNATELATVLGGISLIYFGLGVGAYKQFKTPEGYLKQNLLAAILLLTVAVDLALSGFPQVIAWAIEAFALLWLGVNYGKGYVWKSALGVFALALIALLVNQQTLVSEPLEAFVPLLNFRVLTFGVLGSLLALSAKKLATVKQATGISSFIKFSLRTLVFLLFSLEANDFMGKLALTAGSDTASIMIHFNNKMVQAIVWFAFAVGLVKVGILTVKKAVAFTGLASMSVVIFCLLLMGTTFSPIENFIPVLNLRFAAFGFIAIGVFYVTHLIKTLKNKPSWLQGAKTVFTYVGCMLLFVLLNTEVLDFFTKESLLFSSTNVAEADGKLIFLSNIKHLTISTVWFLYAVGLMLWGILKRNKHVRYMALGLLAISTLKVFIIDLAFLGQFYRIISFMGLGIMMLMLSFFYQKYSKQINLLLKEENNKENSN